MRTSMKSLLEIYDSWEDALSDAKTRRLTGEPCYYSENYIVVLREESFGSCEYVYCKTEGPVRRKGANSVFPGEPCCPFGVKEECDAYNRHQP